MSDNPEQRVNVSNQNWFSLNFGNFWKVLTDSNNKIMSEQQRKKQEEWKKFEDAKKQIEQIEKDKAETQKHVHGTYANFFLGVYKGVNFNKLIEQMKNNEYHAFKYDDKSKPVTSQSTSGSYNGRLHYGIAMFGQDLVADCKSLQDTSTQFKSNDEATKYLGTLTAFHRCHIVANELHSLMMQNNTVKPGQYIPDYFRCSTHFESLSGTTLLDFARLDFVRTFED
jgi:hypothetical protein